MTRRALLIGEISLAPLCALPMELSPSLFIERYHHIPRLQRLIRATSSGGYTPSRGKLVRTGCTTVICTDEPLLGVIPDWNIVEIPVSYTQASLPVFNRQRQQEIAEKFQPKLLRYRLMYYGQVVNSTFNATGVESPVNELVRRLAACVVDDPGSETKASRLSRNYPGTLAPSCWRHCSRFVIAAKDSDSRWGRYSCGQFNPGKSWRIATDGVSYGREQITYAGFYHPPTRLSGKGHSTEHGDPEANS